MHCRRRSSLFFCARRRRRKMAPTSLFGEAASTTTEEENYKYAMQLATSSVVPMALKAVIELGVLEILDRAGPGAKLSPAQIASLLPTHNPDAPAMLDRILRLLAGYSVLTCSSSTVAAQRDDGQAALERLYGLAPVSRFLIRNQDSGSVGPLLLAIQDKVFMESWYYLKDAVLSGGVPFNKAFGMTCFEYLGTDQSFNSVFNIAMSNHATLIVMKILEKYNGFEGVKDVVDVGGGIGTTLHLMLSKYPNIRGINFDLQHVIEDAPSYPRLIHVGGDMFVSLPSAEIIILKWILHDWDDDHCMKLLKNCYKALSENGKLIVVESVLPTAPETMVDANAVYHLDVIMLALTPRGKERTHKEFEGLSKAAGFVEFTPLYCAYDMWVMEFRK